MVTIGREALLVPGQERPRVLLYTLQGTRLSPQQGIISPRHLQCRGREALLDSDLCVAVTQCMQLVPPSSLASRRYTLFEFPATPLVQPLVTSAGPPQLHNS